MKVIMMEPSKCGPAGPTLVGPVLPEVDATRIEVERLRALLRRYDRCECGHYRYAHLKDEVFRLEAPADPLETVVDGEALSDLMTK